MAKKKATKKTAKSKATIAQKKLVISPPNMQLITFFLKSLSPYVQCRFSEKAHEEMRKKQEEGEQAKKRKKREPKDFEELYRAAMHVSHEGWIGAAASCFRNASVSACRLVGFKMTLAKLSLFTIEDGYDKQDNMPLVRIYGDPEYTESPVRLPSGVFDIRPRPMWKEWMMRVRMRFDADLFNEEDVANLMLRVGMQVGIGEGRADSKNSCGVGWGHFTLATEEEFEKFTKNQKKRKVA